MQALEKICDYQGNINYKGNIHITQLMTLTDKPIARIGTDYVIAQIEGMIEPYKIDSEGYCKYLKAVYNGVGFE